MKRYTGIIFFILLLAGGCSLTDGDTSTGEPGSQPRLLISGTNVGLLSDPAANDWSPVMQTVNGKRYLYFLSDREFMGMDSFGVEITTSSNRIGVFRAEMLATPGHFSNLECLYAFASNEQVKNIVVTKFTDMEPDYPDFFASHRMNPAESFSISRINWFDGMVNPSPQSSLDILDQKQLSGYTEVSTNGTTTNSYLFVSYTTNSAIGPIRVLKPFLLDPFGGPPTPAPIAAFPFNFVVKNKLFINGQIDDAWPVVLPSRLDPGKTVFGFVFSYGGVLCFDININKRHMGDFLDLSKPLAEMIDSESGALRDERVLPLFWVTHYPGTVDRTPSIDRESGLYFASDRAGRGVFDLYFVPKEVVYSPETVVLPETQGP